MAYTNFKFLKCYLNHCYASLIFNENFTEKCFIRTDVAHFIKLVTAWPCFKNQHRLTRQFYLRAIGQMIQSTDIGDLEQLFRAVFIVAYSDTEGNNLQTGTPTTCEKEKEWLKRRKYILIVNYLIPIDFYLKKTKRNKFTQIFQMHLKRGPKKLNVSV